MLYTIFKSLKTAKIFEVVFMGQIFDETLRKIMIGLFTILGIICAFLSVYYIYNREDAKLLVSSMIISALLVYVLKRER